MNMIQQTKKSVGSFLPDQRQKIQCEPQSGNSHPLFFIPVSGTEKAAGRERLLAGDKTHLKHS
jgi:hypothetical protein